MSAPVSLRSSGIIAVIIAFGVFLMSCIYAMEARTRIRAARNSGIESGLRLKALAPLYAYLQSHLSMLEKMRERQPSDALAQNPFASPAIPRPVMISTNRLRLDAEWERIQVDVSWPDMPFERLPAIFEPLPQTRPPWRVIGLRLEPAAGPSRGRIDLEIETLLRNPER